MQNRVFGAKHEPERGTYLPIDLARARMLDLDDLDVSMLRGLFQNPPVQPILRKPAKLIARELGVDEATVRSRLKRWESSGFLVAWGATVNQALLGQRRCITRLEVPDKSTKAEVLDKMRLVEGVYRIRDYLGGAVGVNIFFDSAEILEKRVGLVQALAQTRQVLRVELEGPPPPQANLDEVDLKILGAVGWAARRTHVSVARETGLSVKTVRNRLEKMIENQSIGMGLFLDYRRLTGAVVADLLVLSSNVDKTKITKRIMSVVGDRMLPPSFSTQQASGLRLMLANVSEQREVIEEVGRLEGVKSVWLDILVEDIHVAETYYAMERRMIDRVATKRPLSPATYRIWEEGWRISTSDIYPRTHIG